MTTKNTPLVSIIRGIEKVEIYSAPLFAIYDDGGYVGSLTNFKEMAAVPTDLLKKLLKAAKQEQTPGNTPTEKQKKYANEFLAIFQLLESLLNYRTASEEKVKSKVLIGTKNEGKWVEVYDDRGFYISTEEGPCGPLTKFSEVAEVPTATIKNLYRLVKDTVMNEQSKIKNMETWIALLYVLESLLEYRGRMNCYKAATALLDNIEVMNYNDVDTPIARLGFTDVVLAPGAFEVVHFSEGKYNNFKSEQAGEVVQDVTKTWFATKPDHLD